MTPPNPTHQIEFMQIILFYFLSIVFVAWLVLMLIKGVVDWGIGIYDKIKEQGNERQSD